MGKTVFMFPGQGAQYAGMGKEFYEEYEECRRIFDLASKEMGLDLPALCFDENKQLNITEYTQIAILTVEAAIESVLEQYGKMPDFTAGSSLGEYGALVAAKILSADTAFRLVRKRGIYMQEAVPAGGGMSAVLGLDARQVDEICEKTSGIVSAGLYNCPGQTVITGEKGAVESAGKLCMEAGAKRIIPLNVSGPFHSALYEGVGEKFAAELEQASFHEAQIPYLSSVTAGFITDLAQVRQILKKQMSSPVRWQQGMERLLQEGADEFVEIGPGKTLSRFMRKINPDVKVYHIERPKDMKTYIRY